MRALRFFCSVLPTLTLRCQQISSTSQSQSFRAGLRERFTFT